MLKDQRQAINENFEETLIRQYKRLIRRNIRKDKGEQEGGPAFMITATAAVQEVCVIEGDRTMERAEVKDNGRRENIQAAANRVKKNRYLPPPFSLGKREKRIV